MTTQEILARLKDVKRSGRRWSAPCPAHRDSKPSLSITERAGRILIHCHAGCTPEAVCRAAGIEVSDLFADDRPRARRSSKKVGARYDYTDQEGRLLFQVVRFEPKAFRQRRTDGQGGWAWNLDGVRPVLYRLPEVVGADQVIVVEGERDADTARSLGFVATTNPGGAGKWRPDYAEFLAGKQVTIIADADEPGRRHAQGVASSIFGKAESIKVLELPGAKDLSEWVERGGARDQLLDLVRKLPEWTPPPVPDGAILSDVLLEIAGLLQSFLAISEAQRDVLALWTVHTHFIDACDRTPYLHISSPEKRSGKTLLLELLAFVVKKPWFTSNATSAALARKIADPDGKPTALVDEADTFLTGEGERVDMLRGILNAGYARSGTFSRCVGQGTALHVEDLHVFGAKAIAGLRELPDTVSDRSIPVRMKRALPGEVARRFYRREVEPIAIALRMRIESCVAALTPPLKDARPERIEQLNDRQGDIVEPLLAIADLAGDQWAARARAALLQLFAPEPEEQDTGARLLADIRDVFRELGAEEIPTADLIRDLCGRPDAPWVEYSRGRPLTGHALGRMVGRYGIRSSKWWQDGHTVRGYLRNDFEESWKRYLAPSPGDEGQSARPPEPPASEAYEEKASGALAVQPGWPEEEAQ